MTCRQVNLVKIFMLAALIMITNAQQGDDDKCKEDMMHMSQGHYNVTNQNYLKFKQNHKTYILSITDSKCPSCCKIEQTLKNLKDYLDSSKFYKGKQIKLVRADLSNMGDDNLLKKLGLRIEGKANIIVPSMLVYKGGRFYFIPRQNNSDLDRLIHYINRILHPFVKLETEDEIERFLAFYRLYPEDNPFIQFKGQKKAQKKLTHGPNIDTQMDLLPAFYQNKGIRTRVIAFFYDIKEFKDEYDQFKKAATELVYRDDLRIGLVTDKKLIEEVYKKHKYDWFGEFYKTSLILKRHDTSIEMLDFTTTGHSMKAWINRKTLNTIQQYSYEKQKIMDMLGMPIFGAFVDARKNSLQEMVSKNLIEDLKEISLYLKNQFVLTYFNGHQQDHLRVRFGIKHRKVPAIGIHYYDQIKQGQGYPYDNDFSQMRIKNWVNNIMKGNIKPVTRQTNLKKDTEINEILSSLQGIQLVNREKLEDYTLKQNRYDVFIVTFTFNKQFDANQYKILFSECARFRESLSDKMMNTLEILAYDVGRDGQSSKLNKEYSKATIKDDGLGLYIFNVKDKKVKQYRPKKNRKVYQTNIEQMMKFANKNSGYSSSDLHKITKKDN